MASEKEQQRKEDALELHKFEMRLQSLYAGETLEHIAGSKPNEGFKPKELQRLPRTLPEQEDFKNFGKTVERAMVLAGQGLDANSLYEKELDPHRQLGIFEVETQSDILCAARKPSLCLGALSVPHKKKKNPKDSSSQDDEKDDSSIPSLWSIEVLDTAATLLVAGYTEKKTQHLVSHAFVDGSNHAIRNLRAAVKGTAGRTGVKKFMNAANINKYANRLDDLDATKPEDRAEARNIITEFANDFIIQHGHDIMRNLATKASPLQWDKKKERVSYGIAIKHLRRHVAYAHRETLKGLKDKYEEIQYCDNDGNYYERSYAAFEPLFSGMSYTPLNYAGKPVKAAESNSGLLG